MSEYDSMRDYWESHWLAIEIKRERGDDYFIKRSSDQKPGLGGSSLESITSLDRLNPSIQCIDKSLSSPLASLSMARPGIGHEDFSGSLQGVHIQGASSPYDADSRAEPSALNHGGAA